MHSAFFMVQLLRAHMTTEKIIALTRQTIVGKVMFLLFNMLSRFVIAFLPKSKCLLISWLQSPSAVILEPKKIKSLTVVFVSEVIDISLAILIPTYASSSPTFLTRYSAYKLNKQGDNILP